MADVLARQALNRALLKRQMLRRQKLSAFDVIERIVGMQARVPQAPYIVLWTRLEGYRTDELSSLIFYPLGLGKAPAGTLVATDPVSADADYDNGTMLRSTRGSRRGDGGTAHRLACEAREEAKSLLPPSGRPAQVGTTPGLSFRAVVETDGESIMEVTL